MGCEYKHEDDTQFKQKLLKSMYLGVGWGVYGLSFSIGGHHRGIIVKTRYSCTEVVGKFKI